MAWLAYGIYADICAKHGIAKDELLFIHEMRPDWLRDEISTAIHCRPDLYIVLTDLAGGFTQYGDDAKMHHLMLRIWVAWFVCESHKDEYDWVRNA